jgi:hypothetical protein
MPRRSVRKKTLDEFNYHLQLDIVNSLFHHIIVDDSDEDPESDGEEDFLLSCSLKVASSVVLDNSRYLFHSDRYRPNVRSKDLPVDHVPIWQKVVDMYVTPVAASSRAVTAVTIGILFMTSW